MERQYISAGKSYNTRERHVPAPILRREFICDKRAETAELEISAAGFYRLFLNGTELTKGCFAPYVSNPDHIVYYDKYEVSACLREKNVLCVLLGNGFNNSSDGGVWGFESAPFRSAPKVFISLKLDGEPALVGDESFEVYPSAITFDDYRCGEHYDARLECPDVFKWGYRGVCGRALVADCPKGEYRDAVGHRILRFEELRPVKIEKSGNGYLYDFGQNNAGIYRLKIDGRSGQTIDLWFGEFTQKGRLELSNIALFDRGIPGYAHHDRYTCKEGPQEWEPSFTYHGYRYIYAEGLDEAQATEELLTYIVVHSDIRKRGDFLCDDETINRIQECALRSDVSCFHYFPTDCPQREKNGWTADAALSSEQLLYNFDCAASLREWLHNMRKTQLANGAFPGIVPTAGWGYEWGNGPAWDGAIVEIPYELYRFTGDKEIILENAQAIALYFGYLETKKNREELIGFGLGDWLEIGANHEGAYRTPVEVSDTLVCIGLAEKAEYLLSEIGAKANAAKIKAFRFALAGTFRKKCIGDGFVRGRTQTGQAMALCLGLFGESEYKSAYGKLLDIIRADGNALRVGMVGVKYLFEALTRGGDGELLFDMIRGPKYPSYGYWLTHGMTTLNEAFLEFEEDRYPDELIRKDGRGQLTSLNHHCWGIVSAWFYKYLAGLKLTGPDKAVLCPLFAKRLNFARASFENGKGRISTEWSRKETAIVLTAESVGFAFELRLPPGFAIIKEEKRGDKAVYRIESLKGR